MQSRQSRACPITRASAWASVGQKVRVPGTYYAPQNAERLIIDASGQLALRDGSTFPAVTAQIVDPAGPILDMPLATTGARSPYSFRDEPGPTEFFPGTVWIPHDRVDLDAAKLPGLVVLGNTDAGEATVVNVTQGGAPEPGFVVDRFELADVASPWLSIDPATGELSGTPAGRCSSRRADDGRREGAPRSELTPRAPHGARAHRREESRRSARSRGARRGPRGP